MAINLLTEEYKPSSNFQKLSKALKRLSTFVAILGIIALVTFGAITFFLQRRTNEVTAKNDALKQEIKAMEDTETKLVLVRDRLQKVQQVRAIADTTPDISSFESVLPGLLAGVRIETVEVKPGKIDLSVNAPSADAMSEVLKLVSAMSGYSQLEVQSVNFNDTNGGYVVNFLISK